MLKNIPAFIPPELLLYLAQMGHGDEIVLADANFPSCNFGKRVVRLDGVDMITTLSGVLELLPLDPYVEKPVVLMEVVAGDTVVPTIWEDYRRIVKSQHEKFTDFDTEERYAFYERAKNAFAVVHTGESALYANIILKKGVI